jgi:hypothetical protein
MEKALWSRLEGKVRQAARTIEALRKENQDLRDELAGHRELEEKNRDLKAWEKEKGEARERAESLIQLLEGLLESDSQEG